MKDSNKGQVIIYQTEDGQTKLEVQFKNETVWLTIDQMSELFQRDRSTISKHIKAVYEDGELIKSTTCAKFAYVVVFDCLKTSNLFFFSSAFLKTNLEMKASISGTRISFTYGNQKDNKESISYFRSSINCVYNPNSY